MASDTRSEDQLEIKRFLTVVLDLIVVIILIIIETVNINALYN